MFAYKIEKTHNFNTLLAPNSWYIHLRSLEIFSFRPEKKYLVPEANKNNFQYQTNEVADTASI